ncbi:MAG TPA: YceI family protein [Anaerolineales bacterium]|jgi:polyisoprenoid-binding protein YceI
MIRIKFLEYLILAVLALFIASCSPTVATSAPTDRAAASPTAPAEAASATPTQAAAAASPTPPADEEPSGSPSTPTAGLEAGALTGAVRFVVVPEESEARYRVREQLAGVSLPSDAVGVTQAISGTVVINPDGSIDASQSRFVVDLSTLRSDESRRDNFLRQNTLLTNQYPNAVFVPAQVSGLPAEIPESGEVSFTLTGDLTLLDVTRSVDWDLTARIEGDKVIGQATTSFTFDDFNLVQPRVQSVLSVEDMIRLEADVTLQRAED